MDKIANINNICLIGGSGRSGTTLLANIFKNHPHVAVAPEWRFLIDPDGVLDFINKNQRWSPYLFDVNFKRLRKLLLDVAEVGLFSKITNKLSKFDLISSTNKKIQPRYSGINATLFAPNYMDAVERLLSELVEFRYSGQWVGMSFYDKKYMYYSRACNNNVLLGIFQNFIESIILDVLQQQNATFYVEKNTWNILWLDEIIKMLPQSKLVHIYRDPRDVVSSFVGQSWMPSNPASSAIIYRDIYERWKVVRSKVPKGCYLEVSLESLVGDPQRILQEICSFWGIPWDVSLLDKDLSKANSGRWKKELSPSDQLEVNKILCGCVEELGYAEK